MKTSLLFLALFFMAVSSSYAQLKYNLIENDEKFYIFNATDSTRKLGKKDILIIKQITKRKQKHMSKDFLRSLSKVRFISLEVLGIKDGKFLKAWPVKKYAHKKASVWRGVYTLPSGRKKYFDEIIFNDYVINIYVKNKKYLDIVSYDLPTTGILDDLSKIGIANDLPKEEVDILNNLPKKSISNDLPRSNIL